MLSLKKKKEEEGDGEGIYLASPGWTGPQSNQIADEEISIYKIFHLLHKERIVTGPNCMCPIL